MVVDAFRDDRDRGGGSGNDPNAGVDGLLARPLLVVTIGVDAVNGACVASPFGSASSPLGMALLLVVAALVLAMVRTASSLVASTFTVATVSLFCLVSAGGRTPLCAAVSSGVVAATPFGLFEADEAGRCRPFSTVDCMEFCLARDDAGRAEVVEGAGEPRAAALGSKFGWIGEAAMEGESTAAAVVVLLGGESSG